MGLKERAPEGLGLAFACGASSSQERPEQRGPYGGDHQPDLAGRSSGEGPLIQAKVGMG